MYLKKIILFNPKVKKEKKYIKFTTILVKEQKILENVRFTSYKPTGKVKALDLSTHFSTCNSDQPH